MFLRTSLYLILGTALASCAARKHPAPARAAFFDPTIGTISLVNEESRFVLIDSTRSPEPGTLLQGVNPANESTAVLKVSPEKKPPFIIADILKGSPHPGDRAIIGKEVPTETPAKPEP